MSQTTTTTTTETEPKPSLVTIARKTHRAGEVIVAELEAARQKFLKLEPQVRDYHARWQRSVDRRKMLEEKNRRENPDNPFDPEAYTPSAYVLPKEAPNGREFWKVHYEIARLEAELEDAKNAAVGG